MAAFEFSELVAECKKRGQLYLEFLKVEALSMGLYVLPAGGDDPQHPHTEDEVYYIISGRGRLRVGDEDRAVGPGAIIYVKANAEHRFHTIAEELSLLVFFAPAEYSLGASRPAEF